MFRDTYRMAVPISTSWAMFGGAFKNGCPDFAWWRLLMFLFSFGLVMHVSYIILSFLFLTMPFIVDVVADITVLELSIIQVVQKLGQGKRCSCVRKRIYLSRVAFFISLTYLISSITGFGSSSSVCSSMSLLAVESWKREWCAIFFSVTREIERHLSERIEHARTIRVSISLSHVCNVLHLL